MSTQNDIQMLLDGYIYCAVTSDAPDWLVAPVYPQILGENNVLDAIHQECPILCAPSLINVLRSPSPPSVDFFHGLPQPASDDIWVFMVCFLRSMENDPSCTLVREHDKQWALGLV